MKGKDFIKVFLKKLGGVFSVIDSAHRGRATELTAYEARELENIFVLLLLGAFAGIPSPPALLSIELLPYLEREIKVLHARAKDSSDAMSEIAGLFDITA